MHWRKTFSLGIFILFFSSFLNADSNITRTNDDIDLLVMKALNFEVSKPELSIDIYENLFKDTNNTEYLKEAIKVAYIERSKKSEELIKMGDEYLADDGEFLMYKIAHLVNEDETKKAQQVSQELVKILPKAKSYYILGSVDEMLGLLSESLDNFEMAYKLEQKPEYLTMLVKVLVNKFKRVDQAQKLLEEYKEKNGCEVSVCEMLNDLYLYTSDFDKLAVNYEDLYNLTKDKSYIDLAVKDMMDNKQNQKAAMFLIKNGVDEDIAVKILISLKDYEQAYNVAKDSYDKYQKPIFLAQMALCDYEKSSKNVTKDKLKEILNNFKNSVNEIKDPFFYNYYGYLLINNNIDIKRGVRFVERALEIEPKNPRYIDSLAWGYYKAGDCELANELLNTINNKLLKTTKELKKHESVIQKCVKKDK